MRILAVSNEECTALWDYYVPGSLREYDLIISCGDLKPEYLSFLVTMARCPVLYVHGEQDGCYKTSPPEGCDCIDGQLISYNGLKILGLGGWLSDREGAHRYSEAKMRRRIVRLHWKIRRMGGVDLIVTHAPPRLPEDDEGSGFYTFYEMLELYRPKLLLHGHARLSHGEARERACGDTQIINTSQRCQVQVPDNPFPEKHRGQIIWKTKHKN